MCRTTRILTILWVVVCTNVLFAGELAHRGAERTPKAVIDKPYEYPVAPGSFEWSRFEDHQQMVEALEVPETALSRMTTTAVAEAAIRYPLMIDVLAYDEPQAGFEAVAADANVVRELLERRDAGSVLLALYEQAQLDPETKPEQLDRLGNLEMLLAQPPILDQLTSNERETLAATARRVATAKGMTSEVFGDLPFERSVLLLGRVLDRNDELPFVFDPSVESRVREFLRTGAFADADVVTGIVGRRLGVQGEALELPVQANDYDAYVKTPRGSKVLVRVTTYELSAADITSLNRQVALAYPRAVRESNASRRYNCHSYAWYWSSTSNTYWMNDPTKYWSDGSYTLLGTYNGGIALPSTVPNGARATYFGTVHSAVKISSSLFRSKWGTLPVMRHAPGYSPYACMNCSFPIKMYRAR